LFIALILGIASAYAAEVSLQYRLSDSEQTHGFGALDFTSGRNPTVLFPMRGQPTYHFSLGPIDLLWYMHVHNKYGSGFRRYAVRRNTGGYTVAFPKAIVFVTDAEFVPLRYEPEPHEDFGRMRFEVIYELIEFVVDDVDEDPKKSPPIRDYRGNFQYKRMTKRYDVRDLEEADPEDPRVWIDMPNLAEEQMHWFPTLELGPQTNSRGDQLPGRLIPIRPIKYFDAPAKIDGTSQTLHHTRFAVGTGTNDYVVATSAIRWVRGSDAWENALVEYGRMRTPNHRGRMRTQDEILFMDRREPPPPWKLPACLGQLLQMIRGASPGNAVDAPPNRFF
jgi:hypothetical protein